MPGRSKKKPEYDAEKQLDAFLQELSAAYEEADSMIQALLHARKKLFEPSTEVTQMDGQLSLFESVQELAEQLSLSKEKIAVKPYTRTSRQLGVRQEMLAGLPQEVEEYVLPADEKCSVCGGEMKWLENVLYVQKLNSVLLSLS